MEPVGRDARLTDVAHLRHKCAFDSGINVGIVEDDERRVAAELHRNAQQPPSSLSHQRLADRGRAGERHLAQPCILHQRLYDATGGTTRDDVEHAAGKSGVGQQLRECQHRQRRLLCRLDDHGATGGDRRADLAGAHGERKVPGRDQQTRPDRLFHRQDATGAVGRHRPTPADPHGLLGEPAEELRGVRHLRPRLGERLAHLERHQQGQLVLTLHHRGEGAAQDLTTVTRRRRCPFGLPGASRLKRGEGVFGGRVRDGREGRLGRGVRDVDRGAAPGITPLAGDEELRRGRVDDATFGCCGHGFGGHVVLPTRTGQE